MYAARLWFIAIAGSTMLWWLTMCCGGRSYFVPQCKTMTMSGYPFDNERWRVVEIPAGFTVIRRWPMAYSFDRAVDGIWIGDNQMHSWTEKREQFVAWFGNMTLWLVRHVDIAVMAQCTMFRNQTIYYRVMCHRELSHRPSCFMGEFQSVIATGLTQMDNMGHIAHDILPYFLYLPEELRQAPVLTNTNPQFFREFLDLLGMRALVVPDRAFVFARVAYSFEPWPCFSQYPLPLMRLRDFVVGCLVVEADTMLPSRYGFLNREGTRRIHNLGEIRAWAEATYPFVKWETLVERRSFIDYCRDFNTLLLFMGPHGAAFVNIMWMQQHSVVIEIQSSVSRFPFFNITRIFGQRHILTRIPTLQHRKGNGAPMPRPQAERVIERAVRRVIPGLPQTQPRRPASGDCAAVRRPRDR
jgi:hypothetical protein